METVTLSRSSWVAVWADAVASDPDIALLIDGLFLLNPLWVGRPSLTLPRQLAATVWSIWRRADNPMRLAERR